MNIIDNITNINYSKGNNRSIKYIVVHYVGAVSSAKNNSDYFKNVNRQASAHYFVDENDIYRVVRDEDIAWHVGANTYYNGCRNSNSIGVEMCCYNNNGTLDISETVVNRTIELVKELMAKYNIPVENVVRHYDVTHKNCPAPFVSNVNRWYDFKNRLGQATVPVTPSTPVNNNTIIHQIQSTYNSRYGNILGQIAVDGSAGPDTKKHLIMALQYEMNKQYGCSLSRDGSFGPLSKAQFKDLKRGVSGNITWICQAFLYIKGYNPNGLDSSYGYGMEECVKQFQRNNGLKVDGILGMNTAYKLFN